MRNILHILSIFLTVTLCGQNSNDTFVIDPTMKGKLNDTVNTIFCSSFIKTWIELTKIHDEEVQLDSNSLLLKQLNSIQDNNSISNDYLVAKAGYFQDSIVSKINKELEQKFHFTREFNQDYNRNDIISYAYLKKQIEFYSDINQEFYNEKLIFNKKDTVDFFGLRTPWMNPVYKRKLIIHNYRNNEDFIFEIKDKDNLDQVFLAKVSPDSTLESSYRKIIQRIELNDTSFIELGEKLKIPYLNFSIEKDFEELVNRQVLNHGFTGYILREAKQIINFDLNDKGISLESEGFLTEVFTIVESLPRQFIFDKPFFIILKELNKTEPYFCIYIANSNFMRRP